MQIEEQILYIATLAGLDIEDTQEFRRSLSFQLAHGQFKFIEHEEKPIGFFAWLTRNTQDGICVCVNYFFVLKKYRKNFNVFSIRGFFKSKYKDIHKIEWHNQKKNVFKELLIN